MSMGMIPPINTSPALGEQLIGVFSNSASANLDCATRNQGSFSGNLFQSDFDSYRIELICGPPSANQNLLMRYSTDGGATYDASAIYNSSNYVYGPAGVGGSGLTSQTGQNLLGNFTVSTTSTKSVNVTIRINNPLSTVFHKDERHLHSFHDTTNIITGWGAGQWASTSAANAVRFLFASGATFTATALVFGIPKNGAVVGGGNVLAGRVVQVVNTETGAVASGSTQIPYDDTIPQNTEGDQYMSLSITPTSSTNKLKIEVVFYGSLSIAQFLGVALFQDSTASAIAASASYIAAGTGAQSIVFTHYMTAGTTSSTTFKVRAGGHTGGTVTFNGLSAARIFGGVMASSITITEIAV